MNRPPDAREAPRTDPAPMLVGAGIVRFLDPEPGGAAPMPSPALVGRFESVGPALEELGPRPEFLTLTRAGPESGPALSSAGSESRPTECRVVRLRVGAGTSLYGTGEVPGPLLRNGRRTVCWNADHFEYDDRCPGLYQSHPWVLGVRADGSAFGVLADTTWRCEIDLRPVDGSEGGVIEFRSEGPPFAVYVVDCAGQVPGRLETGLTGPEGVLRALAELTGRMPLPPRWALGYQQSRWSYYPESRVREIAREFRERRIPCDVIWLDIDYMDGFRCFSFHPERFPDPAGLNRDLHAQGFRTVWMIDPGLKVDPEYRVYREGLEGDHFVKTAGGEDYHGEVWPGLCAFPDFTRADTRRWWAGLYKEFLARGIDGVWNDMNEPAVMDGPGKTMPEDNVHRADPELGGPGPHAQYHNVYGMLMARATREGVAEARPDRRPFVLTRSSFLGGHRYAAMWTGDNTSDWTHLRWSIAMALNLGLSGQPFAGPDIGGFSGDASGQLFARWMGVGSLLPFARTHTEYQTSNHEPWSFGPGCERVCRLAIQRRYRLLPYLYTLFEEASRTGLPVARPVFFVDPADPALRDVDDCFLLGRDLLVRCRVKPHSLQESPMPGGLWRRFEPLDPALETTLADPQLPQVLLRGGAIVPMGPVMQFSDEKPVDPLMLVVCLDEDGRAVGELYEDAEDGYGYRRGEYLRTVYAARREGETLVVRVGSRQGQMPPPERELEVVVLLGNGRTAAAVGRDGAAITVRPGGLTTEGHGETRS